MYLKKKDKVLIFLLIAIVFALLVTPWLGIGQAAAIPTLGLLAVLIIYVQLISFRKTETILNGLCKQRSRDYAQTESLFSLFSILKVNAPLPPMRGWSISPDFANLIVSLVHEVKPKLIFEASSGVSTLIAAYCLKQIGRGRVISLEHDEKFAKFSEARIREHGLQKFASVIYAPLTEVVLAERKRLWYDLSKLNTENLEIDFLIVDGPPKGTAPLARYPAIPILYNYLSDTAVILLDDFKREDEKKIVDLWTKEFHQFSTEVVNTEHGALVMRRVRGTKRDERSSAHL